MKWSSKKREKIPQRSGAKLEAPFFERDRRLRWDFEKKSSFLFFWEKGLGTKIKPESTYRTCMARSLFTENCICNYRKWLRWCYFSSSSPAAISLMQECQETCLHCCCIQTRDIEKDRARLRKKSPRKLQGKHPRGSNKQMLSEDQILTLDFSSIFRAICLWFLNEAKRFFPSLFLSSPFNNGSLSRKWMDDQRNQIVCLSRSLVCCYDSIQTRSSFYGCYTQSWWCSQTLPRSTREEHLLGVKLRRNEDWGKLI